MTRSPEFYQLDALKQHLQEARDEADRLRLTVVKRNIVRALVLVERCWEQA